MGCKKGQGNREFALPTTITDSVAARAYYREFLKLSGLRTIARNWIFSEVIRQLDYSYPVYQVEEVGFKLSKRKERIRPNQLCTFRGQVTQAEFPNLHLATEPVMIEVQPDSPTRVLDHIKQNVAWT